MKNLKLKTKANDTKGITLVALVITIIVLLILATVSVQVLTGDNGLLTKSKLAVDKYSEGEIKERIMLAVTNARMKNMSLLDVTTLDNELKSEFGDGNYELLSVGEGFLIAVNNIEYLVDNDGNVADGNNIESVNLENAGDLSKEGQYDGLTEETAYRITCVEDLVELTNNYNNYKTNYIVLENTVNFKSIGSYKDPKAKTVDINENGKIEELITELSTGTGFKPITTFSGIFDGKNNEINNIYIKSSSGAIGLFSQLVNGTIKNTKISGDITHTKPYNANSCGGGFAGLLDSNSKITNCINGITLKGNCNLGGIVGKSSGIINGCTNLASIETMNGNLGIAVGGIVGMSNGEIINSCNIGKITSNSLNAAAGICGNTYGGVVIKNCYNVGTIECNANSIYGVSGGILGYIHNSATSIEIDNCYNVGELYSKWSRGEIIALIRVAEIIVNNCAYLEKGINQSSIATQYSKEYMQSQEYVDELNTCVDTYNEEHKNDEDFIALKNWQYNQGNYPTFE